LASRLGPLLKKLRDPDYFNRFCIDAGALCWPNGLEISPAKIHELSAVLQFFIWAFMNGDALVQQNNFVRLPDRMQSLAFKTIASVRDASGTPLKLSLN
jgi:hypothetical protein